MKMIALLFKDLIRGGVVIIITAVTSTAAAVMVSLYRKYCHSLKLMTVKGVLLPPTLFPTCVCKAVF